MTEPKQHLYLVDGSSYIFRAYHRLPPLTDPQGTPVGAVYGYTTMLWKLAADLDEAEGPTHLAVILDASGESFRNDIYEHYKANRPAPPEDLVPQFPLIRDATRAFSLPCIEVPGLEADDLIATYARRAQGMGWNVTIVSSDKDLMQLVGEVDGARIDMLDTMKSQRIYLEEVEEKFGVPPELVSDVLALMGDSVDNVPGIFGIGPKTASKLIAEHGSLTAALDAAPAMKPSKLRDRLIEGRGDAELSKVLVTLKEDCDLPQPIAEMKLGPVPPEPLAAFLAKHGFTSLLKRLETGNGSPARTTDLNPPKASTPGANGKGEENRQLLPEAPKVDRALYETVQTLERLEAWVARAMAARLVAVDTETTSLDAMRAELVGVSLALGPNDACYIPLAHLNEGGGGDDMFAQKPQQVPMDQALAALKPLLEADSVVKVFQNGKYDLNLFARAGIHVAPIEDTMVISFALDAGRGQDGMGASGIGGHGMDELSERHLGHTPLAFKDICGTGKKAIQFGEVPLDRATEYAAEDADVTLRLYRVLKPRLAEEGGTRIYERVDRPLIPVVAAMEREGIKVDRARLAKLSEEFAKEIARLEGEIHAVAGEAFTVGSPKQLGEVLFDKLGYKGGKKGKSGQYSTDVSVLEKLAAEGAPIARLVLEWRQLSKLKSTYTDALQEAINPATGRVHTSYSLVGAQTGRLSSTDPNLQNIPVRTAIGRQIREAFVPEPGNVLLAADYSQIELRLAAHMAGVDTLKQAFANGEDIHARTATEMFGEVTRDTRARAKTINFAILYGISRWGLATRLEVAPEEAQAMIDTYFQRFPGIQRYIMETLESVRAKGYSETLFGRKTWFPRINSKNQAERQGSERAAINAPIQGTSADIIKRAMARMLPALADAGLDDVRMLLQVHDELVFELPEAHVEEASPIIRRVMAEAALPAVDISVPLGVDIGTGMSWDAAH